MKRSRSAVTAEPSWGRTTMPSAARPAATSAFLPWSKERSEPCTTWPRARMSRASGYIAGLLGQHLDGPARVSLDASIPVDHAFGVERLADGRVVLSDGAAVLAHAEPAVLQLEPPTPPSFAEAQWASERYLGFTEHAAPECFVCGPAREWGDGLAIFPGPLPRRHLVAAPWAPDPTLFDRRGTVRPEFVWAALDCPSSFALLEAFGRRKAALSH